MPGTETQGIDGVLTNGEAAQVLGLSERQVFTPYGLPLELYADRHTIFFSPQTRQLTLEDELVGKVVPLAQFGRAINELGIHLSPAFVLFFEFWEYCCYNS